MKRPLPLIISTLFALLIAAPVYGQCTPDPDCVDDDDKPGQFCPLDLPAGAINVYYDETITVIPPGNFEVMGSMLNILYIEIDSVKNMPPGIQYFPNEDTLYPETAYCIQLSGTPTQVWDNTLQIHIAATVMFGENEIRAPVVDDTSIVISIKETVGIEAKRDTKFRVFQNAPNPFTGLTRLAYYMPFRGEIELNVYNLQGIQVHHETELVSPGEHSFGFDGIKLAPGTYIYRVRNAKSSISGKLVKSK